MSESKGVIYILTNPSFPNYVKIGYADDINRRLKELNRSECIPFAFRVYATYEVPTRLKDLKLHDLIDKLNPNLRSIDIDTSTGKKRVREFFAMTCEDAYKILEAMAELHCCLNKLKIIEPSAEDIEAEDIAENIEQESKRKGNSPISLEVYLSEKNPNMVDLYMRLQQEVYDNMTDTEIYVLPQYIGWRKNGKYFAVLHIRRHKISIDTLAPDKEYSICSKVPDNFLWTLNYCTQVSSLNDIKDAKEILLDSYRKR